MKVKVTTVDTELEFETANKTKAKELFFQVSRNLGVHEHWFFGLLFIDKDEDIWIDASKKSVTHYKAIMNKLKYRVKYYPENIEELIEEITIRYFYLQVRAYILSDKIYCPPDTCVLLASYAAQARHADFNPEVHNNGFLSKEKLLPKRVLEQHKMEEGVWETNIINMWKKHRGMFKEDAMLEYLKITLNLEMFGIHYFDITNQKGSKLSLGISALGLNIYKPEDKLNPTIQFPWAEIGNINFRGTKFTIKYVDKKAKPFVFFSKDPLTNKRILNLGVGYHKLYVARRKPETLEITRMKDKAKDRKMFMMEQKKRLQAELHAREQAEQRERNYLDQIASMKKELSKSRQNLLDAEMLIQRLRDQLEDLQKSKELLEEQQNELRSMLQRLEDAKNAELAEREKLEEEIRMKQLEVLRAQEEVSRKNEEARKLQEAVEEAKRHEEELKRQREEEMRLEEERAEKARLEAIRLEELRANQQKQMDENAANEELKLQLKELQTMLDQTRDESKDTENDKIHRKNLAEGRDKYQTLAKIRKGNTTRRVELFENF